MTAFRIVPLSQEQAAQIREQRIDSYGIHVTEEVAGGYGPCRISLRAFRPGHDRRLLFRHSPFEKENAFNQPGPIFIFSAEVEEYSDVHRFPPEIKADKKHFPLSLIGYSEEQQMVYTRLVGDDDVDELIPRIFDRHPEIAYLHARNAAACCYICRIERA